MLVVLPFEQVASELCRVIVAVQKRLEPLKLIEDDEIRFERRYAGRGEDRAEIADEIAPQVSVIPGKAPRAALAREAPRELVEALTECHLPLGGEVTVMPL